MTSRDILFVFETNMKKPTDRLEPIQMLAREPKVIASASQTSKEDILRWYIIYTRTPIATKAVLDKYTKPISREVRSDFKKKKENRKAELEDQKDKAEKIKQTYEIAYVSPSLPQVYEVFVPQKLEIYENNDKKSIPITNYIFVKASYRSLKTISKYDTRLSIELGASRSSNEPAYTDDNAIEILRRACDNELHLEILEDYHKDTSWYDYAVIVRNKEGESERIVGRLANIGRNGLKLIFDIGIWKVLVTDIQKFDVQIQSNSATRQSKEAAIARQVYYFLEKLKGKSFTYVTKRKPAIPEEYATNKNAPSYLRRLLQRCASKQEFREYATALAQSINENSSLADRILYTFFSSFDDKDYLMLGNLSSFLRGLYQSELEHEGQRLKNEEKKRRKLGLGQIENIKLLTLKSMLQKIIPDTPVRPFLTAQTTLEFEDGQDFKELPQENETYKEYLFKRTLQENSFNDEKKELVASTPEYYASVIETTDKDGNTILFTSWRGFYEEFADKKDTIEQMAFIDKLNRYELEPFCTILRDTLDENNHNSIQFYRLPMLKTSGIGVRLQKGEDKIDAARKLIEKGIELCKTVMLSARLRPWQRAMANTWLRHTYDWEKSDLEIFEREKYLKKCRVEAAERRKRGEANKKKNVVKVTR